MRNFKLIQVTCSISAHVSHLWRLSHVHLDEVGEGVVYVGSFREEEAAAGAHVVKEEQLLVL